LVDGRGDRTAILWEGEPGDTRQLTYAELHREVWKFANVLKQLGIQQGDRVSIYMPMVPELAIAMLACARIGAIHSVIFGLLAIALFFLDTRLFDLQSFARDAADRLDGVASNTGPHASHDVLSRELHRLADLDKTTVTVLAITATAYAVIEGIEAVGLWLERRWAEYLTVVATAGFLPFEIRELLDRVTVLRLGALVVNVAILVWLVYSKRLFGMRGGAAALHEQIDWDAVLAAPTPPESAPPHPTPVR
jgi:uncharacterized membrane protein (DUF2068 family)